MFETAVDTAQQHRSPGLTAIYNEIKVSRFNRVLDLGASSAKSFNFFRELSCKIRFANLVECVVDERSNPRVGDDLVRGLAAYLDEFPGEEQFDVILAWDLFNYLDLPAIEWLIHRLTPFCRPGALLHAVKYVSAKVPLSPRGFQILDQHKVSILQSGELGQRHHPNHETTRLLRSMPSFYIENSYLNFAGMVPGLVEQVLRFQPGKAAGQRRLNSDELAQEVGSEQAQRPLNRLDHESSALPVLLGPKDQQPNLLDLGLKNNNNRDYLYGLTRCLYAENIYEELQLQGKSQGEVRFKPHMLNFPADLRFDVILTWDILNFLPISLIEDLFQRLEPHTHSQTQVHAIVYSGRETPAQPQQFYLQTASGLTIEPSEKHAGSPPLTSTRLLKAMKRFVIRDTFIFRPGMQRGIYEYLFHRSEK